ncbi:MAG TPA: VWA domain-containing protein [Chloroflexota bacterium]|nr:VWA domain-containing protein [Chloroflexota bacterium]
MTFAWPAALLALAFLPAFAAIYVWMQRRRQAYAVRFTNLALLREIVGQGPGIRRHVPPLLFLLGLTALLISLARPSLVLAVPRAESDVILVVDVSGSMAATDLQPSRLGAATKAARTLIDRLPDGARIGVVSFSQGANVVAPLSSDRLQAERALDGLVANGGTAIGDGLNAALNQLSQRPRDAEGTLASGRVILLSDGENSFGQSPSSATARASQQGVQVDTVGIGQRGAPAYLNRQTAVGLDETTLKNIAERTGGQYFYASDEDQLTNIYANLGSQVSWVPETTEVTALASGLGAVFFVVGGALALRWFGRLP